MPWLETVGKRLEDRAHVLAPDGVRIDDPAAIAGAARALARIVALDWPEGQQRRLPALLLQALCRLAERGAGDRNEGWTPTEIAKEMVALGVPWGGQTDDNLRARVNDHWKSLEEIWTAYQDSVVERLAGDGLAVLPWPDKPPCAGGRENKARYRLRFFAQPKPFPTATLELQGTGDAAQLRSPGSETACGSPGPTAGAALPVAMPDIQAIRYYPVPIALPWLLRWIPARGLRTGSPLGLLLSVLPGGLWLVLMLGTVLAFFLLNHVQTVLGFLQLALAAATSLAAARFGLGWWLDLVENGVTRAPMWWQSLSVWGDNVIERRLGEKPTDPNRLHLVRYVADCPICGADGAGRSAVRLGTGRIEFYGRIVGRCRHAPNEHVWSFDHIAGRGRFLR